MTLGKTQIMNHVILAAGVPARMHFTASRLEPWDIHDSYTGELKTITRLVLHCDMVDGLPVNADYSVAGDKHRLDF